MTPSGDSTNRGPGKKWHLFNSRNDILKGD